MVTQVKRTESIPCFASTKSERAEKYNTEMRSSQAELLQTCLGAPSDLSGRTQGHSQLRQAGWHKLTLQEKGQKSGMANISMLIVATISIWLLILYFELHLLLEGI